MSDSNFDEAEYLAANPDVSEAVKNGKIRDGFEHYVRYGRKEGRLLKPLADNNLREDKVFSLIDKKGLGLEIGPSHNPIAPKKKGYNVHILDLATADELKQTYNGHGNYGVKPENIEEVDFVWRGEPLPELIGATACYDWIIASHVIEHIPDLVSFIQQCEILLKPEGILSLIIPDKRYCFDHFSPCSLTGSILDSYSGKRIRPSPGQVFDYIANSSMKNGHIAWSADRDMGPSELIHSFSQAKEFWINSTSSTNYVDAHCWRFTPASFRLVISDLHNLGLINLTIQKEFETVGCEFYISLGKRDSDFVAPDRLTTLQLVKNNNIEDINQTLSEKDNQIEDLNQMLQETHNKMAELMNTLDAMVSSASWRLTSPLRRAKWLIHHLLGKTRK